MKEAVPGIILITSCEKYRHIRLPKFMPSKSEYNGWKVFVMTGNPVQPEEYIIEGNMITVRAEDSYIHGLKKFSLTLKVLYSIYDIQQGILSACDDLVWNESALLHFLCSEKEDYMGWFEGPPRQVPVTETRADYAMVNYYKKHPKDFMNPLHRLPPFHLIQEMITVPIVQYVSGVITYFSNKSVKILIDHLESINWDITTKDEFGYPYIIADIAIGYILNKNSVFGTKYNLWAVGDGIFESDNWVTLHTEYMYEEDI